MTQKNYISFAAMLKSMKDDVCEDCRRYMARRMAIQFADDNSKFDWNKFMTAAGFEDGNRGV